MKITDLTHRFDERTILDHVDLSVSPGECVGIIGPSGSGKSTLLQILGLLRSSDGGTYELNGVDITTMQESGRRKLRQQQIGFVFQESHLIPYLTVLEQLKLIHDPVTGPFLGETLLDALGVVHRAHQLPRQLSGGERQRVAIARALINAPTLILADEPTASLDFANGRNVMETLAEEAHDKKRIVLIITHDERMLDLCDRVLRLQDGRLDEVDYRSPNN